MDISARVLREVEFSGSLRGYNTDEVDEFLENVAQAVDGLQAQLRDAVERAERAERSASLAPVEERPSAPDDDAIRRTLVLAQRTADLAIKEAQDEAAKILEAARGEADSKIAEATLAAERLGSDAERRLRDEVTRLGTAREDLRREVGTLVSLLGAERARLTESLSAALGYVERSLTPSADLLSLPLSSAPGGAGGVAAAGGAGGAGGAEAAGGPDEQAAPLDGVPPGRDVEDSGPAAGGEAPPPPPPPAVRALPDFETGPEPSTEPATRPEPAAAVPAAPSPFEPRRVEPQPFAGEQFPGDLYPGEHEGGHEGLDDLEAAIAEDAAAAAPAPLPRRDEFNWRSDGNDRPGLKAVPPLDSTSQDTAVWRLDPKDNPA